MKAYFQVKNSTNLNKIAIVSNPVDIDSFRKDDNWYEITEEEYNALFSTKKEAPKTTYKKVNKE
jgi:hypothetical protein